MRQYFKTDFFRSVSLVTSSNVIANAIAALTFLFMVKVFSQDIIGHYSVFIAHFSIITAFLLGSYHWSIPNVDDDEYLDLVGLLVLWSLISSLLVLLIMMLVGYKHFMYLGVYVFAGLLIQICDQVNVRKEDFKLLSYAKISLYFLFAVTCLTGALFSKEASVLMSAQAFSWLLVSVAYLYKTVDIHPVRLIKSGVNKEIFSLLKKEKKFPFYVAPSQLFLVMTYQVPTILIERYFGAIFAAQYFMTIKFCSTPIQVVGSALSQAYHGRLAYWIRTESSDFYLKFKKLSVFLWMGGVAVTLFIYVFYPMAINFIFGNEWSFSGEMARIMSPVYGATFAVMPLSMAFVVLNAQRDLLFVTIWGFVNSLIGYTIAIYLDDLLAGVAIFTFLTMLRYLFIYLKQVKMHKSYCCET